MSWFGWLTKGYCEMTGLDRVIEAGELIALVVVGCTIWYILSPNARKPAGRRWG